jgi:hypothetical protein
MITRARLTRGAISFSSCSHLPAIAASDTAKPVTLPPGWARFETKPPTIGSLTTANTTGIVVEWIIVRVGGIHHRKKPIIGEPAQDLEHPAAGTTLGLAQIQEKPPAGLVERGTGTRRFRQASPSADRPWRRCWPRPARDTAVQARRAADRARPPDRLSDAGDRLAGSVPAVNVPHLSPRRCGGGR